MFLLLMVLIFSLFFYQPILAVDTNQASLYDNISYGLTDEINKDISLNHLYYKSFSETVALSADPSGFLNFAWPLDYDSALLTNYLHRINPSDTVVIGVEIGHVQYWYDTRNGKNVCGLCPRIFFDYYGMISNQDKIFNISFQYLINPDIPDYFKFLVVRIIRFIGSPKFQKLIMKDIDKLKNAHSMIISEIASILHIHYDDIIKMQK